MDYALMFPSKYVSAADLKGQDVTLTIATVEIQKLEGSDGTFKTKGLVTFEGAQKAWVLNRTNAEAMKLMWGAETDNWVGKRITIYPQKMKDPFSDSEIFAIRVRGSPDIDKPAQATVQRGRKSIRVSVRPTATKRPNGKAPQQPAPKLDEPPEDVKLPTLADQQNGAAPSDTDAPF